MNDRAKVLLEALSRAGGVATLREIGLPGSYIGWANTMSALAKARLVDGEMRSPRCMTWWLTEEGRAAVGEADGE